ncbi:hypothetical protein, partial [Bifidobacterium sp.]
QEPSPEELSSAFTDIGTRGRSALADMRELLGVLRETGFSDAAQPSAARSMQLKPPKNIDEQCANTVPAD